MEMFGRILVLVADIAGISARYEVLRSVLDERAGRLVAAAESQAIGKGGISSVAKATGMSRPVIRQGIAELKDPTSLPPGRVRPTRHGADLAGRRLVSFSSNDYLGLANHPALAAAATAALARSVQAGRVVLPSGSLARLLASGLASELE